MTIQFKHVSLNDEHLLDQARRMMAKGQAEGAIPAERRELCGDESAIFAFCDSGITGVAVVYAPDEKCLWLDILYVQPEHRRQGIATALIEEAYAVARISGLASLEFGTLVSNGPMQALATRAGFGQPVVYMERPVHRETVQ